MYDECIRREHCIPGTMAPILVYKNSLHFVTWAFLPESIVLKMVKQRYLFKSYRKIVLGHINNSFSIIPSSAQMQFFASQIHEITSLATYNNIF